MSYFTSKRCRLYYHDSAESDPSSQGKPVVLFVNGWAVSSRYWTPLVERLSAKYRCITYDQSGTGKTVIKGYNPTFTIQGFTDEAAELIEHLGLHNSRKLHIVGHSMGGMVATELCLRYRDALLSATIIACGALGRGFQLQWLLFWPASLRSAEFQAADYCHYYRLHYATLY